PQLWVGIDERALGFPHEFPSIGFLDIEQVAGQICQISLTGDCYKLHDFSLRSFRKFDVIHCAMTVRSFQGAGNVVGVALPNCTSMRPVLIFPVAVSGWLPLVGS